MATPRLFEYLFGQLNQFSFFGFASDDRDHGGRTRSCRLVAIPSLGKSESASTQIDTGTQ